MTIQNPSGPSTRWVIVRQGVEQLVRAGELKAWGDDPAAWTG
jgi:hypothetical protein